jgi:hypothetical protein
LHRLDLGVLRVVGTSSRPFDKEYLSFGKAIFRAAGCVDGIPSLA